MVGLKPTLFNSYRTVVGRSTEEEEIESSVPSDLVTRIRVWREFSRLSRAEEFWSKRSNPVISRDLTLEPSVGQERIGLVTSLVDTFSKRGRCVRSEECTAQTSVTGDVLTLPTPLGTLN